MTTNLDLQDRASLVTIHHPDGRTRVSLQDPLSGISRSVDVPVGESVQVATNELYRLIQRAILEQFEWRTDTLSDGAGNALVTVTELGSELQAARQLGPRNRRFGVADGLKNEIACRLLQERKEGGV